MNLPLFAFVAVLILLFLLKAPIWASLLLSSASYLVLSGEQLTLVARKCVAGMDNFLLMAIPMFILAAELMNHCGIVRPDRTEVEVDERRTEKGPTP